MGYYYFNWTKMDDPSIVGDDPEVLVYHTGDDGTLVLGAVEWVVPTALGTRPGIPHLLSCSDRRCTS